MKSHKLVKIFVTIFVIAFALALYSCGDQASGSNTNKGTESVTTTDSGNTTPETEVLTDGLPDRDMGGTTFNFLNYTDAALGWALKKIDSNENIGEIVNDAIYLRNQKIEERFNCLIEEIEVSDVLGTFKNSVTAGDAIYDIGQINDEGINNLNTAGVLITWETMPYVNLEEPWWNKDANDTFQINGKQYAAVGDFNLSEYSKSYIYFFNKDMYKTIHPVNELYGYVKNGAWTVDKLVDTAKEFSADINGDGVFDTQDQYGLIQTPKVHISLLVTGAGVKYVDIDADGNPYFAIPGNTRSINVLQKLFEMHVGGNWYYRTSTALGGVETEQFQNNQALFLAATMWSTEAIRQFEIDIGILPAPKFEESQENYYSITVSGLVSALPKTLTTERSELVSILLEAMAFDSRINLLPVYKNVVLQTKYARDEESSEMIDVIFNSQTFDLGVTVWGRARNTYITDVYFPMVDVIASVTERLTPLLSADIQASIDALNS
jgi:hypothetical protein